MNELRKKHTPYWYELLSEGFKAYFAEEIPGTDTGKGSACLWSMSLADIIVFMEVASTIATCKMAEILILDDDAKDATAAKHNVRVFCQSMEEMMMKAFDKDFLPDELVDRFKAQNSVH